MAGIGIALSPVAAQTNPPQPPAVPAAPAAPVQSQCAAVPALPPMPDGAHSTRAVMDAYNATYTRWTTDARAAMACRREEATTLRTRAAPLVEEFNTAQARVNAINAYWTAWVNHLNGQSSEPSASERGRDIVNGEIRSHADDATTSAAPELPDVSTLGAGPVTPANSASQCGAIPEPAHPPDTTHMSAGQMRSRVPPAVTAYNTWLQDAQAKLVCRHDEAHNLGGQADALITEYNASSQLAASSSSQWRAEAEEFNARTGGH
jgi:hypothetical protein